MKNTRAMLSVVVLSISTCGLAEGFLGTDNFNDGVIAANLWAQIMADGDADFQETDGQLYFLTTSTPGPEWSRASMPWRVSAPFDKDWQAQVKVVMPDLANTTDQQYQLGLLLTRNDAAEASANRVSFLALKDESNLKLFNVNIATNGIEQQDLGVHRSADSATIRFRWIAATSNLRAEVSTDAGNTWTNPWGPWHNPLGMAPGDGFVCMIDAGSKGERHFSPADGLYCDDFALKNTAPPQSLGSDDFDDDMLDASKWGGLLVTLADSNLWLSPGEIPSTTQLVEQSQRLEFLNQGHDLGCMRPWAAGHCGYEQSWAVQVDVHLGAAVMPVDSHLDVTLGVAPDWLVASPSDFFALTLDDYNDTGDHDRAFIALGRTNGETSIGNETATSSTTAALRISFDASTKVLRAFYDDNGNADGYHWGATPMAELRVDSGGGNWNMKPDSRFTIFLGCSTGDGVYVSGGQAFFDDFRITAEEPLKILNVTGSISSGLRIRWTCYDLHSYQLEYSESLSPENWQELGVPQTAGFGETEMSYVDTLAPSVQRRFYRVVRSSNP